MKGNIRPIICCFLIICLLFSFSSLIGAAEQNPTETSEVGEQDIIEIIEPDSMPNETLPSSTLEDFSIEQLLLLKKLIENELTQRGYTIYPELKSGSKGSDVKKLQTQLKKLGYFGEKVDGTYGTKTVNAMKQFEAQNGLEVDGKASNEDQQLLFSNEAIKSSGEIAIESPKVYVVTSATAAEEETDAEHAEYGKYDYTEFFRYPENHFGEKVKLDGKIVQVIGSRTIGYQIRLALDQNSSNIVYVYIFTDPGYNLLEKDKLTIYGWAGSPITYETIFGGEVTIPSVFADEVVLKD